MRNTFLVTYDVCDDKRLARVHKTMRGFGDHLQYSVFECQLTPTDLVRCRHLLSEIIDHRKDQVLFVDLGSSEGRGDRVITALGKAYSPIDSPCIIVDRAPDGEKRAARSNAVAAREPAIIVEA